ncbi:MAG: AAA family ATPase [Sphaerochaetaceae bacterium]|nr:AAA family ATPase [Sphaerochaetaceae bacterium]
MKNSSKALRALLLLLIIAVIAVLALDSTGIIDIDSMMAMSSKKNYVPYTEFNAIVASGDVTKVTIESDRITFTTHGGTFITDNPEAPNLKAELLSQGIEVAKKEGASVTAILDVIFDVIFFGAVAFGVLKLIEYSRKTFKVVHNTGVHFSDIAGMDNVKSDMKYLTDILRNPKAYEGKGVRPVKGVILEGPPGNGKTLFAKALAQETNVNFIATKGADFQSAMMSMGARKIKMLFAKAARRKPCIIFIDEFDSIGERRNYAGTGIDKENNRIITTMLNEMDGFTANNGILVIAATNSYASLDPALVRPGRFDLKYTITNPDAPTRSKLVEIYTRDKILAPELTNEVLTVTFDGLSCSAIEAVLNQAQALCQMSGSKEITIAHIVAAAQKTGSKLNIRIKGK